MAGGPGPRVTSTATSQARTTAASTWGLWLVLWLPVVLFFLLRPGTLMVLVAAVAWGIVQLRQGLVEAYGPAGALGAIALALPALLVVLFSSLLLVVLPLSGVDLEENWGPVLLPYALGAWVAVVLAAAAAVTLLRHRAGASSEPATS